MTRRGRPQLALWIPLALLCGACTCLRGNAWAAGFAIIEQSVSGLGNAFAGGAAAAEDPSTIFFNPAGLTRLKGQQAILGGYAIITSFQFDNDGSTHVLTPVTGEGLTGDNGGNGGTVGLVPNVYYSASFSNGLAVGLGVNAPFGLATDWDDGWVGRYHALNSDVKSVCINPSIAYRISPNLSIGVGASAMYMYVNLSQAIDFGTLLAAAGDTPQRDDGEVTLKADDWGYGYNVGILWEVSEDTRMGAHYRSRVKQELEGDADFDVPAQASAVLSALGSDAFVDTDAGGDIDLPDTISVSFFHRFNPRWEAMADVTWTHWSLFDELRITFENPQQPASVTTENWKNAWRVALGATYHVSPAWLLRFGVAWDQTPVPNAEHRTPRLPDNDRYWVALGAGYRVADWCSFDVAYAHLFVGGAEIDKDPVGEDTLRGGLKGDFTNSADIVSAQLAFRW